MGLILLRCSLLHQMVETRKWLISLSPIEDPAHSSARGSLQNLLGPLGAWRAQPGRFRAICCSQTPKRPEIEANHSRFLHAAMHVWAGKQGPMLRLLRFLFCCSCQTGHFSRLWSCKASLAWAHISLLLST